MEHTAKSLRHYWQEKWQTFRGVQNVRDHCHGCLVNRSEKTRKSQYRCARSDSGSFHVKAWYAFGKTDTKKACVDCSPKPDRRVCLIELWSLPDSGVRSMEIIRDTVLRKEHSRKVSIARPTMSYITLCLTIRVLFSSQTTKRKQSIRWTPWQQVSGGQANFTAKPLYGLSLSTQHTLDIASEHHFLQKALFSRTHHGPFSRLAIPRHQASLPTLRRLGQLQRLSKRPSPKPQPSSGGYGGAPSVQGS